MAKVIDGYKVYEDTESAMYDHWDYDAMYEIPVDENEDSTPIYGGIADLIDRFIATGVRG